MTTRVAIAAIALCLCVLASGCADSAEKRAAEAKATEQHAAAEKKALADKKAGEEQAAAERKAAAEKAAAEKTAVAAQKRGDDAPKAEEKSDTIWKVERTKDGIVLSDGKLSVTFPADAKVEAKGSYASVSIKQETETKLQCHLSIERKDAPADVKKATNPRKWLEGFVRDAVAKDRNSVYEGKKDYNDVKLVKTCDIPLGEFKGLKSITDHERALTGLTIEGGLHSVEETDHYIIGDHLYFLRAGGSGAPRGSQLFGDHTGFHRSELAQQFFKSAKVLK